MIILFACEFIDCVYSLAQNITGWERMPIGPGRFSSREPAKGAVILQENFACLCAILVDFIYLILNHILLEQMRLLSSSYTLLSIFNGCKTCQSLLLILSSSVIRNYIQLVHALITTRVTTAFPHPRSLQFKCLTLKTFCILYET